MVSLTNKYSLEPNVIGWTGLRRLSNSLLTFVCSCCLLATTQIDFSSCEMSLATATIVAFRELDKLHWLVIDETLRSLTRLIQTWLFLRSLQYIHSVKVAGKPQYFCLFTISNTHQPSSNTRKVAACGFVVIKRSVKRPLHARRECLRQRGRSVWD